MGWEDNLEEQGWNLPSFEEQLFDFKERTGADGDKELEALLELEPGAVASWRKKEKIPNSIEMKVDLLVGQSCDADIKRLKKLTNTKKDIELAKVLGVAKNTVGTWRVRGSVPKKYLEMLKSGEVPNIKDSSTTTVVYYDITASAGAGRLIEYVPSKRIELSETLRLALNIQVPSKAKLMNMEGDSMLPTLKDKSILAIEELETFKQDGVYVFTFDDTLYVKRLQKNRDGVKVISDNPIYDPWVIRREEVDTPIFTIHGRVTGCAQSV